MALTPAIIRKLRTEKNVSLLDIAARTGLPEDYISRIEDETVIALESDLARIRKAILQAYAEQSDDDEDEDE